MKYIILLGDGMADWPLPEYANRTPLEIAQTPAMDEVVRRGTLGLYCPIPEGMAPGSDVGNLSIFGYDPQTSFRGRAPIEAANQGIPLAPDQVAFRCNLVTLGDGLMQDFTAGHITSEEGAELIAALNRAFGADYPIEFFPGVSYRHLALIRAQKEVPLEDLVQLECEPPHNITGKVDAPYWPRGEGAALVREIMMRSQQTLKDHPVNEARKSAGRAPATSIWLWGQGQAPAMESYQSKFGLTGAVVSAVDLVKGIGKLAGLEVINVPGATGWIDTNYEGKIAAGLDALDRHDFVYIHIEAPDETSHQGRADLKIQAIEDFDRRIVAPALAYQDGHPECRILVTPDHFTTIETKTHAGGPLPFALCGPDVASNGACAYSEVSAAKTGIELPLAHPLIGQFLRGESIALA